MVQVMKPAPAPAVRRSVQSPLPVVGGIIAVCLAFALVLLGGALLISLLGGYLAALVPPAFDAGKAAFWWAAINRH